MKPYKAKTLSGAQSRVRDLEKVRAKMEKLLRQYQQERRLLAMLAADGPCFDNPIVVAEAKQMRNNVLRIECRLTPDGKYLQ